MTELELLIEQTTGYKNSRQNTANFILARPELLEQFLFYCFEIDNPNHYKACWALELISYEKLEWFQPYLDLICSKSQTLTNESAIRPLSKILYLILEAHYRKNSIQLTEKQLQYLIETNFDWLINDSKVAAKAHAMRCLFLLGTQYPWIHPELKTIITKDFSTHTAAYKAVSKQLLKKLK
ncbi:hypothetical protein [Flavobacterium sp. UMI-01]|uniref:hypothetical protein n=1 Tax=Flavobacterium sp. UMI-01 TaxID=1441053 RepID=UPI001C7DBCA7|nr:hypothetical protein [Flavobacterium sp. UMI-01]GIZ07360.1 hypothetical protein FUMI01_00870 [Flavobacterium sp. UMI-01]